MDKLKRVEKSWEEFINRTGKNIRPDTVQYQEMRKAFYGGYSGLLMFFLCEVSNLPEERGVQILEELRKEVTDFWDKEVKHFMKDNKE